VRSGQTQESLLLKFNGGRSLHLFSFIRLIVDLIRDHAHILLDLYLSIFLGGGEAANESVFNFKF
jgi:hypothetical protein